MNNKQEQIEKLKESTKDYNTVFAAMSWLNEESTIGTHMFLDYLLEKEKIEGDYYCGYDSSHFAELFNIPATRYIEHLIKFLEEYKYL